MGGNDFAEEEINTALLEATQKLSGSIVSCYADLFDLLG